MLSVLLLWEILSKGITRRKMADEEGVRDLSEDVGNLSVKDGPCVGVTVDRPGGDQNMTAGAMAPVTASERPRITTEEEGISDIAAAAGRAAERGNSEVGDTETPADVSPPVVGCPVGHVACGSDTAHVSVEVTDTSRGGCSGDIPAGCVECGDVALGRGPELQETCVSDGQGDREVGHDAAREKEGRQDWHEAVTDGKPATGSDVSFGHVTTVTTACQAESDGAPEGGCSAVGSEAGGGASASAGGQLQSSRYFTEVEEEEDPRNFRKIFVGNIGYKQNWRELKDFFSQFGKVVYAEIVRDVKRSSKGFGFVEFATEKEADFCLMEGIKKDLIFKGRKLRIDYATETSLHRHWRRAKRPTVARTTPDNEPAEGEEDKTGLLTMDAWAMIFSYLTICEQICLERVCKRWRDMALLVWKNRKSLSLKRFYDRDIYKCDKNLAPVLSRCGPFLHSLDLGYSGLGLTNYCLTVVGHYCPHLRKLHVEGLPIKTTGIKNLSKVATNLMWISLPRCCVGEKGLWWLFKNCQKLEHVDITENGLVTGKCFYMMGPHLRSLHANRCTRLTDYCVEALAQRCPNIQKLRLGQCCRLTEASLVAVTKFTRLEVLDFASNSSAFDEHSGTLLSSLHNLTELKLDYIDMIQDDTVKAVTQGCPKLQKLSLRGCKYVTRQGLSFLLDLTELSTLDISYIEQVSNTFLKRLSALGRLQDLTMHFCLGINDIGVWHVLELSPRLRRLDLSCNALISVCALIPLVTPISVVDRRPHHTLEIFAGCTLMTEPSQIEDLTAMKPRLPPHVILSPMDCSDPMYELVDFGSSSDDGSSDEEDVYTQFYMLQAQALDQYLQPAGNIGQMEDDVGEAGEGAYGPPVPEDGANSDWPVVVEDWGGYVNNDWPVQEDWGAEANNDWPVDEDLGAEANNDCPVEEDWGAEVNPPGPTVPVQVTAEDLRAYDDLFDDDDEDYDEFLVNDDPLEMERWDLS